MGHTFTDKLHDDLHPFLQTSSHTYKYSRCASISTFLKSSLFWVVINRMLLFTEVSGQPVGPIFEGQAVYSS
jgi:hypothetical protein